MNINKIKMVFFSLFSLFIFAGLKKNNVKTDNINTSKISSSANQQLKNEEDINDFINGNLLFGTGGGGDPDIGRKMLTDALNKGITLRWVDSAKIPDESIFVTVYGSGSIAPMSSQIKKEIEELNLKMIDTVSGTKMAIDVLSNYLNKRIVGIVPVELGAESAPQIVVLGNQLGQLVVDGDYSGRADPEEMQGTPFIYNKKIYPIVAVDQWGNTLIVKYAVSTGMIERIEKMLSLAAYNTFINIASVPLPGREVKKILVPGTLTKCLSVGRAIRKAKETGSDPIEAEIAEANGWRLFEGVVAHKEWKDENGYMIGTIEINGIGNYKNQKLKVWFKNENQITWLNEKPFVTSPDLVTLVDRKTAIGKTNTSIAEGDEVVAIGMKGLEVFRTPQGLNAAGPRHFGFDFEYRPIEKLFKK